MEIARRRRRTRAVSPSATSARSGWRDSEGVVDNDERKCQGYSTQRRLAAVSERRASTNLTFGVSLRDREGVCRTRASVFFRKRRTSREEKLSPRRGCGIRSVYYSQVGAHEIRFGFGFLSCQCARRGRNDCLSENSSKFSSFPFNPGPHQSYW